jgi:hypothetical protein
VAFWLPIWDSDTIFCRGANQNFPVKKRRKKKKRATDGVTFGKEKFKNLKIKSCQ